MAPFFAAAVYSILLASNPSQPSPVRRLEVCLSPGCVADGADATLRRLRALTSQCDVANGKCASACGAGPVVIEPTIKGPNVVHKRIKGESLIELLTSSSSGGVSPDPNLVKGYDLCDEADAARSEGRHGDAVRLYEEGIALALQPATENAVAAASKRDEEEEEDRGSSVTPPCLEWIVEAHLGLSSTRLAMNDADGALDAACNACELSKNGDALCFEAVAEVCRATNDGAAELEALQTMFALAQEEQELPSRDVSNRRRSLGFRMAKLEREVNT